MKIGSSIDGYAFIQSNRGEFVIPIKINVIPGRLKVDSNSIDSLESFAQYASQNFSEAVKIFQMDDFPKIFQSDNSNIYKLYRRLCIETRKSISLDDFLIAVGKKEAAKFDIIKKKVELPIKYFENKKIKYKIPLHMVSKIVGWGTLNATVSCRFNQKWIELSTKNILSDDVKKNNEFEINCTVDTSIINNMWESEILDICGNFGCASLELIVKRDSAFSIELSKSNFDINDAGFLKINNNSETDIVVDIDTYDRWIKFNSKKYIISSYAEIPFEINISKAFDLIRMPIYSATVSVKSIIKEKPFKKYINVNVIGSRLQQFMTE